MKASKINKFKEKQKKLKSNNGIQGFKLYEVIIITIITGILCSIATGFIFYKKYETSAIASYENLSNNKNVNEFLQVYASIIKEYYQDVNEEELVDSAINAMFSYLGDNYSEHLSKDETSSLLEQLAGEYQGIGVEIYQDKIIYNVFDDSPAKEAGLQKGDKIIKVNNEDVSEKDNSYVATKIKNENDKVEITILRNNEEKKVTVKKDKLYIPSVTSKVIEEENKKIGYIDITTFSNTTSKQVKKALLSLEKDNIDSLVIDVRNNAGGYLISAKEIASMFLEKEKIIYSLQEKDKTQTYKDTTSEKRDYPVVVLINEYSASASEILTSALKESYNATLVGKKSYGKGKVQQTLNLEDGSMAKYTTAKWLTPNGKCIDGVGITPDYEIDLDVDENNQTIVDTQLNKAIEILKNKQ
ncbi:MAG TPA: S41 family peptidase [Bacilli bacterium]|nr:S41 family peptidase [Bacilli bacterium]